jgi:hypothetical protein
MGTARPTKLRNTVSVGLVATADPGFECTGAGRRSGNMQEIMREMKPRNGYSADDVRPRAPARTA